MFKAGTVLVVGAGASKELKFPLGADLATRISTNLMWVQLEGASTGKFVDHQTSTLITHRPDDLAALYEAAVIIAKGVKHAVSIDAFIDTHRENPFVGELGKLQIALEIARAERQSDLHIDPRNIYNRLNFDGTDVAASWLKPFAKILLDGCRASNLSEIGAGLTIICFNYDRCIEQYLTSAIAEAMAVDLETAHAAVTGMKIFHPYGSLGPLPKSAHNPVNGESPFGFVPNPWSAINSIRTYTEEMAERETLQEIRAAVEGARNLLFMGFSFAPQNMKLLEPDIEIAKFTERSFFSTGVGLHEVAHAEIKSRMLRLAGSSAKYSKAVVLPDMPCAQAMIALTPILADPSPNLGR